MPPMEGKKEKKEKKEKKRKMGDKKGHRNASASSPTVSLAGNGGGHHRRLDKNKSALKESEGEYASAFSKAIPEDDVTFATSKRIHRTAEPNVPADVMKQKLPAHVRDCLGVFSKDWQVCQYSSRGEYGHGTVKGIECEREELMHLHYDHNNDLGKEGRDGKKQKIKTTLDHFDIDGELSGPPTLQEAQKEVKRLSKHRYNIFRLYGMDSARVSDPRPMKPTPMSDQIGLQVLLELKDFRMQVEDVDVFYGSAGLYNLSLDKPQNRGRLSELFHFTLTDSSRWGSETDFRPGPISRESLARRAIFSIEKPSPDLYVVFRFEKILWGDVAHATDFYTRTNIKPKEYMKLRNEGVERAGKLGKFSQSFVCAAIQLFPEGSMVVGKDRPLEHSITNLLRMNNGDLSDDALFSEIRILTRKNPDDQLSKSLLASRSRKSKNLPGKITCTLFQVLPDTEIRDRVTPSLIPISPFNSTTTKVIREIQAFTLGGADGGHNQSPFLSYVHHLYVYPESLNFSSYEGSCSARNLCCEVMLKVDDVDETPRPLPVITGRAVMSNFVSCAYTSVQYHEQRPHFFEEVRISLPPELLTNHHLLFCFKHIICALPKGKKGKDCKEKMEEIAGYAWMRVLDQDNCILGDSDHDLPCALELPQRYLSADPSTVKWVDRQREVFTVRTRLISSIVPRDNVLSRYFIKFNQSHAAKDWSKFTHNIKELRTANQRAFVHFLPVLLNQLFHLFAFEKEDISLECMTTIGVIVEKINALDPEGDKEFGFRHPLLTSFISTMFSNPEGGEVEEPMHLRLMRLWTRRLTVQATNDDTDHIFLRFIWFMFDIVTKSRVQYLYEKKLLPYKEGKGDGEDKEFGKEVTKLVKGLLASEIQPVILGVVPEFLMKKKVGGASGDNTSPILMAMHVNDQLALFIKDLIPLLSSSTLTELILAYTEKIDLNHPNSKLTVAKFEFLRIIVDYEHYIPINRPPKKPSVGDPERLMDVYMGRHVMAGLVIQEVLLVVVSTQDHAQSDARTCALNLLIHLLFKHSCDERYTSNDSQKSIASIYFPYVLGLIEEEKRSNVLTVSISNKMIEEDTHKILLAFLWVVRQVGSDYLRTWLQADPGSNLKFFLILWKALDFFDPGHKERGELFLNPSDQSHSEINKTGDYNLMAMGVLGASSFTQSPSSPVPPSSSASSRRRTSTTASAPNLGGVSKQQQNGEEKGEEKARSGVRNWKKKQDTINDKRTVEEIQHLHREVTLMAVKCVWHMLLDLKDQAPLVIKFLVMMLKQTHSQEVLDHLFQVVRYFVNLYKEPLFVQKTSYCGDLTLELVRYCNFYSTKTRGQAAGLLYLLFRNCWEMSGHLVRMKLQCSVAVARLVGDVKVRGSGYLSSSLKAIARHAENDPEASESFKEQLDDLFDKRLSDILKNVTLLQKWEADAEAYADVLHQIAAGWHDSPDIRYHWMDALASRHIAQEDYEEAAQCYFHIAALILSHLEALKPETAPCLKNPAGRTVLFRTLLQASPNCGPEFTVVCSPATAIAEGMCCSDVFTDKGFEKSLAAGAKQLNEVKLYETAIMAHRLVGISLNMRREWNEMSGFYALAATWSSNIDTDTSSTRALSNFYLVKLFGPLLEQKHESFVYKENKEVAVTDLSSRLNSQFGELFGEQNVLQLPTRWSGKPEELDKSKAHFQIIPIMPYLSPEEQVVRMGERERQTNVSQFYYEASYSADPNKKVSEVGMKGLGMKRVVIKTANAFPFVVKRSPVVERREEKFLPVEYGILMMEERGRKLQSLFVNECRHPFLLQSVFRSTLGKGVSFAPLEICSTFLGDTEGLDEEQATKLRFEFESFLKEGAKALQLHADIIKSDKKEEHEEMVKEFEVFQGKVEGVLKKQEGGGASGWVRGS